MTHDIIVLGTGGVGSAALFHAARAGHRVLGIDRFPAAHDRGSSHGESRIIRLSYFEHPDYVPILRRSYTLWDELSERSGKSLFHRCGLVYFGEPGSPVVEGVLASAREHALAVEELTADQASARFPGFVPPDGARAIHEPDAGYLMVEDCVRAHIEEAVHLGAEHRPGVSVREWHTDGEGVEVVTDAGKYRAAKLIVTAGSWSGSLLGELGIPLRVLRKHLHWFAADSPEYRDGPGFFFDVGGRCFYGFPAREPHGLKVADHTGGTQIADPLADDRSPEADDDARIEAFLRDHLPGVSRRRTRHEVCFYTTSPDEHFLVDRLPGHENVVFAAGLSGHGFKFASSLGEALVRLATEEKPSELEFLSLERESLRRGMKADGEGFYANGSK